MNVYITIYIVVGSLIVLCLYYIIYACFSIIHSELIDSGHDEIV